MRQTRPEQLVLGKVMYGGNQNRDRGPNCDFAVGRGKRR